MAVPSKDNQEWWAYVRYCDGQAREEVQVKCITMRVRYTDQNGVIRKKRYNFDPKNVDDFDRKFKYSVSTMLGSSDGIPHNYYAQIGKVAEKKEDLHLCGRGLRVAFDQLPNGALSSEDVTTEAEIEETPEGSITQNTVAHRKKRRTLAAVNVQGQALRDQGLLSYNSEEELEEEDNQLNRDSDDVDSESGSANRCGQQKKEELTALVAELRAKLRESEQAKEALMKSRAKEMIDHATILKEMKDMKECFAIQLKELNTMSGKIIGLDEKMDEVLSEFIGPPNMVDDWLRKHFE